MKQKYSDLLEDLKEYAYNIANWRVDQIESRMEKAPDDYPEFAAASKALDEEKERMIQKLGGDFRELEPMTRAFLMYQSILIYEVYTQAVMDGGRVLHAFVSGELPAKPASYVKGTEFQNAGTVRCGVADINKSRPAVDGDSEA